MRYALGVDKRYAICVNRVMQSISALINDLGGPTKAAELLGLPAATTVASWRKRGSIPVDHWPRVLEVARERGLQDLNYEKLVEMHVTDKVSA